MMTREYRRALRSLAWTLSALLAVLSLPAVAGSFSVNPVRVVLSAEQRVASLEVRNTGASATSIQLETVSWSQDDQEEVYAPTRRILATPPIFTLAPGESQVVRVGLREIPQGREEVPFRLFLEEIPAPDSGKFQGLRVALRLGVPVFVQPGGPVAPQLEWRLTRLDDDRLQLEAENRGNGHAKLGAIDLEGLRSDVTQNANGYLLPGHSQRWTLPSSAELQAGASLAVKAQVNGRSHHGQVRLK